MTCAQLNLDECWPPDAPAAVSSEGTDTGQLGVAALVLGLGLLVACLVFVVEIVTRAVVSCCRKNTANSVIVGHNNSVCAYHPVTEKLLCSKTTELFGGHIGE